MIDPDVTSKNLQQQQYQQQQQQQLRAKLTSVKPPVSNHL
jgi:hypothetical protein